MKPMSARDYRAHAESVKSQRPTEVITLKSGSVFELRRPDLQGYVLTGRVPQSLLLEGMKTWKDKTPATANRILGDEEIAASLILMREVVHDCTVNPKFVEFATNDNEISASDMLPEDFQEIFSWAMGYEGMAGLTGLQSFLKGRTRGAASARTRGKKQRVPA
jgi:hypothetical protein